MWELDRALTSAIRYRLARPRMVVVMGMHRSGTSCVTRVLNLMGASLGPVDGSRVPGSDELHWESGEVNWINEAMLTQSGGSWLAPPAALIASTRDYWRCRQLLWRFTGAQTAALKDPRMMLTYRVWKRVLPPHRLVMCIRNPLDVARSLARRDSLPLDDGIRLWATYNRRLLEEIDEETPVHWVDFDDGASGVRRLVRELDGIWGLEATPLALAHYDPRAHHHNAPGTLPGEVAHLHAELKRCAVLGMTGSYLSRIQTMDVGGGGSGLGAPAAAG